MEEMKERKAWRMSGFFGLLLAVALSVASCWQFVRFVVAAKEQEVLWGHLWAFGLLALAAALAFASLFIVKPNEARVLVFFGRYVGTVREVGFHMTNPLTVRPPVSVRVRNFNTERLKVNDAQGNPIEIAAVVVWKVADTAKALFDVDNYEQFVNTQAETAVRSMASRFPYDAAEGVTSLRGDPESTAVALRTELAERLRVAGVEVLEARLTHLAYAPDIAQAMLRRQQAEAVIAARHKIVEAAVGMVGMALAALQEQGVVSLDEERKANMVNNLLVALISEAQAQPVINAGSIY